MSTTTTIPDAARAALEHVAGDQLAALDAATRRPAELAAAALRNPSERIDPTYDAMLEVATGAVDELLAGGDPTGMIAEFASTALHDAVISNETWRLAQGLLGERSEQLLVDTIDQQLRWIDHEVRRVVDEARDGGDHDTLRAEYVSLRRAWTQLISRKWIEGVGFGIATASIGHDPAGPPTVLRLGWLRNLDAWEHGHAAEVDGNADGIPPSNFPPPGQDAERFDWLVANLDAVPWAPTLAQVAARHAELVTEVTEARDARQQMRTKTRLVPEAMAARLGVDPGPRWRPEQRGNVDETHVDVAEAVPS